MLNSTEHEISIAHDIAKLERGLRTSPQHKDPMYNTYIWASIWDFQQYSMCNQQKLRSAYEHAQSDQSLCWSLEYFMTLRLPNEHHLEFVSKLQRRLHRLVWVYTSRNATLLEITCRGSVIMEAKKTRINSNRITALERAAAFAKKIQQDIWKNHRMWWLRKDLLRNMCQTCRWRTL